jgi:murein DD-endopeptidase MepM/ murein hydrolase activator NlpD
MEKKPGAGRSMENRRQHGCGHAGKYMIDTFRRKFAELGALTQRFLVDRHVYILQRGDYVPVTLSRRLQVSVAGGVAALALGTGIMMAAVSIQKPLPTRPDPQLAMLQRQLAAAELALQHGQAQIQALTDAQRKDQDQHVADAATLSGQVRALQTELRQATVTSHAAQKPQGLGQMVLAQQHFDTEKACLSLELSSLQRLQGEAAAKVKPPEKVKVQDRVKAKPVHTDAVAEAAPRHKAKPAKDEEAAAPKPVVVAVAPVAPPLDDDATVPAKTNFRIGSLLRSLGMRVPDEGGPFLALGRNKPVTLDPQTRRLLHSLPLTAPLVNFRLVSPFGPRVDPINGRASFHPGIDLAAPYRSPVYCTGPGVVVHAGWEGAYGKMVEIDHGHGIHTRYGHLSRVMVNVGQHVAGRTEIGLLGSTGRSTGPHVHYEIDVNSEPVDPVKFLNVGKSLVLVNAPQ